MPEPSSTSSDVVFIENVRTPYRIAQHRRFDQEIDGVRFLYVYTHDIADQAWKLQDSDPARVFNMGQGDSSDNQGKLSTVRREWAKGGRIIREILASRRSTLKAVVLGGYNDPGRLRILAWCHRNKVPAFVFGDSNIHDDHPRGLKGIVKKAVVGRVVRMCAGVLPCGSCGAAYFARYGATPERTFFVPYEPDYQLLMHQPPDDIAKAARELGLAPDRRRVVFCSRLVWRKRGDQAIDAFAAIADERPDWDLLIVGSGELRAELEARVPERLKARVRFLGFIGEASTIAAIYRSSDVFLHPAIEEPWGVVINEAVAAGMAMVSADTVGASAEFVQDGVNGRMYPRGDLEALTNALRDATSPEKIDLFKSQSHAVLKAWLKRGDPVLGMRRALKAAGILGG